MGLNTDNNVRIANNYLTTSSQNNTPNRTFVSLDCEPDVAEFSSSKKAPKATLGDKIKSVLGKLLHSDKKSPKELSEMDESELCTRLNDAYSNLIKDSNSEKLRKKYFEIVEFMEEKGYDAKKLSLYFRYPKEKLQEYLKMFMSDDGYEKEIKTIETAMKFNGYIDKDSELLKAYEFMRSVYKQTGIDLTQAQIITHNIDSGEINSFSPQEDTPEVE